MSALTWWITIPFLGTFATMAKPIEELHIVFATVSIANAAMHTTIINQEGFTHLDDLATLVSD